MPIGVTEGLFRSELGKYSSCRYRFGLLLAGDGLITESLPRFVKALEVMEPENE